MVALFFFLRFEKTEAHHTLVEGTQFSKLLIISRKRLTNVVHD